jgi:tetratricopeptide (TPR) repeat protein
MISIFRLVRLSIRVTDWVVPRAKEWHRLRHLNRTEGEAHFQKSNFGEAEKYLALAAAEQEKRKTPLKAKLPVLLHLAESRQKQGKFLEARQTIGAIMVTLRQSQAQVSPEYARCLDLLAKIHQQTGNLPDARRLFAEAIQMEQALKTPDLKNIALRSQRLAAACKDAGDLAGAADLYKQSIALHETAYGPDHSETGNRLADLGILVQAEGQHEEALPLLQRALAIHEKSPGADSPEASRDLEHIAAAFNALGRFEEACERYERALHLKERQVGVSRAELVAMQVNLAKIYASSSRFGRAQELLQQIILVGRTPGPEFDEALQLLASLYDRTGRSREAAEIRSRIAPQPLSAASTVE